MLIFGVAVSTLNDMDASSKTDITVVCDEENYEGQNSFTKEQVIPSDSDNHAAYGRPDPKTIFIYPSVWVIRKKGMIKGKM